MNFPTNKGTRALVVAIALLVGVAGATLADTAAAGPRIPVRHTTAHPAIPQQKVYHRPVRYAVLGDSETSGMRHSLGWGIADGTSWTVTATAAGNVLINGWARSGATTTDALRHVRAWKPEVLVVELGTNDLRRGIPWSTTRSNLIKAIAKARAQRVILAAIPPRADAQSVTDFNLSLRTLAYQQGYFYFDPWVSLRIGDAWKPAYSVDGIHATKTGFRIEGAALGQAIQEFAPPEPAVPATPMPAPAARKSATAGSAAPTRPAPNPTPAPTVTGGSRPS